ERRERMDAALQRLRHRGPDESGRFAGDDFVAGHTRLAIIDLKGGHQPMRDPSERWALVFNGEIYNYRELRAQLAGRWGFRDDSDTEVLLAGLVTEGARFVERLDGMWAFVLHDAASGDVLLSRDRFGKKPLYYRRHGAVFACASELPALAALTPDVAIAEDASGIADYFRYGYALPGTTCVSGVSEVLPAHTLRLRSDGSIVQERYWAPSVKPWTGSFEEAAEQVRELLTQGVRRRQLASDVEVGAFLSGGVDSTTVCALAQASGFGRLRTFTAGFAEPTYDERAPAARAAAELGTLLTADGSDEIFGGYARYAGRLLRQRYHRLPASLRSIVERGVLATPEPYAHHSGSLLKRAHLFVRLAREDRDAYIGPPAIRKETLAQLVPGLGAGNPMPDRPWPNDPDELRHMLLM